MRQKLKAVLMSLLRKKHGVARQDAVITVLVIIDSLYVQLRCRDQQVVLELVVGLQGLTVIIHLASK